METKLGDNHGERISKLETSVQGLYKEFDDIRGTLRQIQNSLSRSKETNWSVVFAGLAIVGCIWAAAIRPINQDIEREIKAGETLASAVIAQNQRLNIIEIGQAKQDGQMAASENKLEQFRISGTPTVDKRLMLLEYRVELLEKKKK